MTIEQRAADYLWERDACRARCFKLERENARLKMLLQCAQEAIEGEYALRIASCQSR
jgi:hypothetical protein